MIIPTTLFLLLLTGSEWAIESIIASALSKGLTQSLLLGLKTVCDFLYSYNYSHYPFKVAGLSVRTFRTLSIVESTLNVTAI
jgi:hypothetical protein